MMRDREVVALAARSGDPDRYVAALYAPEAARPALFALAAFDAEITGIRDRIRDPLPGEVRLQWWRDVIAGQKTDEATGHPVADALGEAVRRFALPQSALQNYVDARVFDLYDDPMPSRTDLEGYCGESEGALIQLSALVLDATAAAGFADLAGHAGCARAMTSILRRLPLHRARGQCYIPRDLLAAAGTTAEAFVTAERADAASGRAVEAMTALARDHLGAFERRAHTIPPSLRPAFLPIAVTAAQLRRAAAVGKSLADLPDLTAWKRHWALFRHARGGWPLRRS